MVLLSNFLIILLTVCIVYSRPYDGTYKNDYGNLPCPADSVADVIIPESEFLLKLCIEKLRIIDAFIS